jgi:hypothetical protein
MGVGVGGVGAGVCPRARVEAVVLGVAMEVSESVEVDSGEWIWRETVLGMIVSGEEGASGVVRVWFWSGVVVVVVAMFASALVFVGVSVPGDGGETDLTKLMISSEMRCQAEMVFK